MEVILEKSESLTYSKLLFSKISFRNTVRVSNGLDPSQDQTVSKGYMQMIRFDTGKQTFNQYKQKDRKDQESIQSSTTPVPKYQMGK